jgi:hypothetical protein
MNSKNNIPNMSCFRLSLVDFLRESHPHMVSNRKFIAARTEAVLDVYEKAVDEQEYRRYFNSLKSSVLTVFYTLPEVIKVFLDVLKGNDITPVNFLEP